MLLYRFFDRCDNGYKGTACDQCETYAGCEQGTCTVPGECVCNVGWGGLLCERGKYSYNI